MTIGTGVSRVMQYVEIIDLIRSNKGMDQETSSNTIKLGCAALLVRFLNSHLHSRLEIQQGA